MDAGLSMTTTKSEVFSSAFYGTAGIRQCPNGDKLRSGEDGLFCLVDGIAVPAGIKDGSVKLLSEDDDDGLNETNAAPRRRKRGSGDNQEIAS